MPAEGDRPGLWDDVLGIEWLETTPERVRAQLVIRPKHHQGYGIAHGGVYASVVESVASHGAALRAFANGQKGVVGVSNTTHFLRSTSEGELIAEGLPLHVGRSAQLWEVRIERASDGKLVSQGQVRFHVLAEPPSERR